jgi:2-polyprenyl-3-methyl-5-hydroxy-6-metoxy-1,4-benzoquinol methylase
MVTQKNSSETGTLKLGENFTDSSDHYNNAILRLMQVDQDVLNSFFAQPMSFLNNNKFFNLEEAIRVLQKNWVETLRSYSRSISEVSTVNLELDSCFGRTRFDRFIKIARNPEYGVAINSATGFGVLVHSRDYSRVKNSETDYESDYFQGEIDGVGYGNLDDQKWRSEKAERLVRELRAILVQVGSRIPIEVMSILDIGSGYGQFLNELKKIGSRVSGLDISEHAVAAAKSKFQIVTHQKNLDEFTKESHEKFDLITMWDYIEHPDDPLRDLLQCFEILKEGGFVVIKTPNVLALECDVFVGYYHSLKQEHLNYFSPNSLTQLLNMAGFDLRMKYGISHLFQGINGGSLTSLAIANGKESDILLIAQKKSIS